MRALPKMMTAKDNYAPSFQAFEAHLPACLAHESMEKAMPQAHEQFPRRMDAYSMC